MTTPQFHRLPQWRSGLIDTFNAYERDKKTHVWGQSDCALFAADCVLAMTGEDPAKGLRGKYKTAIGAAGVLRRKGFESAPDLAASLFEEISPSLAGVGDLVSVQAEPRDALGVVAGSTIRVMTPEAGLGILHLSEAKRAFRVPSPVP